jgi:quinol monooxygenase YgiN
VIAAFEAASGRFRDRPGVELYALHEVRGLLVVIEKYESEQARSGHRQGTALASATWADVTATSAVDDARRRTPATTPPGTASPDLVTATPEKPKVGGSPCP